MAPTASPTEPPTINPSPLTSSSLHDALNSALNRANFSNAIAIVVCITILAAVIISFGLVVYYGFGDGPERGFDLSMARHMPDCLFPQPFREAWRARRARRKEAAEQRMASGERGVELGTLREEMVAVASDEEAGGSRQWQGDEQVEEQDVGERRCIREIEREGEDGGDEETTAFPPFDPGLDIDYTGDAYVYSTAAGQIVDFDRQSSLVVENQVENESDDDEDDSDNIPRRLDQYHAELRELQAMVAAGTVVQVRRGVRELAGRDDFNFDATEPGARRSVDSTRSEREQSGGACTESIGADNIPRLISPLPPTPRSQFAQLGPPRPEQPPAYSSHELRSPVYAETDPNP